MRVNDRRKKEERGKNRGFKIWKGVVDYGWVGGNSDGKEGLAGNRLRPLAL